MDDNTREIRDDKINVEEIMAKIRENIRKRQTSGELPLDPELKIGSISKNDPMVVPDGVIERDLSYINTNWDIHNNSYFISSHHPHIGKFLVKGRQMVHGEVRRYVDPMISRQTQFNNSSVRIMTQVLQKYDGLNQRQQDLETAFSSLKQELDREIADSIITAKNETINELNTRMNNDIQTKAWLAHLLENRVQEGLEQKNSSPFSSSKENINYFLFEERFRGSNEELKQRQRAFLQYFEKCSNVLDIGCGRGEFLEILRENDICCTGIDSDPDMVAYCCSHNLNVQLSDAIKYLETLKDDSYDGIFMDQVVEHLEPEYLIRLLALCYRKLKNGCYIVVETVNPLSLVSFFNFYLDMSHKKPVHPFTLKFLLESSKYREIELKYYSEIPEKAKLLKIHQSDSLTENEQQFLANYNYNIDMLNLLLWGPMDYAVIGKK